MAQEIQNVALDKTLDCIKNNASVLHICSQAPTTYAPSDDLIRQRIRAGKLPIIVVDSNEATPQEDMHWVVGIGIDARGRIVVHDPWDNAIIAFRDRYKKPVIRFTGYSHK